MRKSVIEKRSIAHLTQRIFRLRQLPVIGWDSFKPHQERFEPHSHVKNKPGRVISNEILTIPVFQQKWIHKEQLLQIVTHEIRRILEVYWFKHNLK